MSRFHRVCILIQTISLAIIALFFLLVMVAWLALAVGLLSLGVGAGAAAGSAASEVSPVEFDAGKALDDIRKEGARRALGISGKPPAERAISEPRNVFEDHARQSVQKLKQLQEEQALRDRQAAEEKARREWAPNGPRQK